MTSELTTRDLIELSLLDAMGLLDDDERAAFERAFAGTSPAVQAHIRREQTRLAQIDFLLPDVEAPAGLRAMVLEAVRKAMAEGGAEKVAADSAFMPAMIPSRRVSPLWRAGAVGFATAAVVLGYATFYLQYQNEYLSTQMGNNAIGDQALTSLGSGWKTAMFNPNVRHVMFSPTSADAKGEAVLLLDEKDGTAFLVCQSLPALEGREYRLAVVDDKGAMLEQLASFPSNGFNSKPVRVKLASHQRLGILPPSTSDNPTPTAILTTEPIGT